MKILSLKLKGFIGIQRGMGLEEISLDLSKLAGLIALAGQNGRGKSTIMENLQPYRTLASRNTSLKNHVFLRDSYKDMTFSLAGAEYRTMVKIDSGSDRSEGFIWKNGLPQVDGKVRSFDRYLVDLLGSPELFFNSVFAAQGSKKVSDLTTGELKKLFSEFLRLHVLEAHEQTSKQAANSINMIGSRIVRDIEGLNGVVEELDRHKEAIASASESLDSRILMQVSMKGDTERAEQKVVAASEVVNRNAIVTAQLAETRKQLEQARKDYAKLEGENDNSLMVLKTAYLEKKKEIKNITDTLADEPAIRQAAQKAKDADAGWRLAIEEIEKAQSEVSRLSPELHSIEMDREKLNGEIKEFEQATKNIDHEIKGLENDPEISKLMNDIEHYRKQAEDLQCAVYSDGSPCRSENCRLLSGAIEAEKKLADAEASLSMRKGNVAIMLAAMVESKGRVTTDISMSKNDKTAFDITIAECHKKLSGWQEKLKVFTGKASTHRAECEAANLLAARLPEIDQAAAKLPPLESRLSELAAEGIEVKSRWEARERGIVEGIESIEGVIRTQEAAIEKDADAKLKAAKEYAETVRAAIALNEKEIASTETRIAGIRRDIEEAEKKLARKADLEAEKFGKDREASEWLYLKNACGASGLRALEIDSVAPTITGSANELLSGTFGPQYSVRFQTLDPETGKEVLDILALADDGSEVLLENLSGGQKVWILKALRLAMTLVSKEKSGMDLRSSFADEEDGSLDLVNAQNFIGMYRSFMKVGGFDDLYFISHRPTCVDMADHILTFREGGIDIG